MENRQRFSALYLRDFRLFWFGQIISFSGTWMHSVAQSWLVYLLTKSPLYLGIIASLSSLPILLFTHVGGMIVDRYPKKNIIIVTQLLSAAPALAIAILTDKEIITVWHIGVAALFLGTVYAFDIPARYAFLAEMAGKADITNAVALNSAAFNGARIIGPILAGFIIYRFGIAACFYINAISFIPVILALSKIKAKVVVKTYQKGFMESIADGWKFVIRERPILCIISLISVFSLFGIPYIILLPVVAYEIIGVGVKGLSLLVASAGAGSFVAVMAIAFKGEARRKDIYIFVSASVFSLAIFGLAFSESLYISMSIIFFAGVGIASFLTISNSFIQHAVPDSLRGRVMSVYTLVFLGLAPIGNSLIGLTATLFDTITALKIFGIFCIIGSIIFSRMFTLRFTVQGYKG